MVLFMLKKNWFYIALIIIYLLFLMKDTFFRTLSTSEELNNFYCTEEFTYYKEEYNNLLNSLDIAVPTYHIEYTKVIARDIYEFFDKITIAKGANNNLKTGDLVINNFGLVGVISAVNQNSSEVHLLTNSNINISVKINNSYGILSARDSKLYVKNIKSNSEINVGDSVYTSGLTNIPEAVFVGEVSSITKDNLELEYIIELKSSVDFYNLKYLGVIST